MRIKKLIIFLISLLLLCLLGAINVIYINPKIITVREEIITSDKVKDELNNLTILFFSDLHYMTSIKEKELSKLVEKINSFDVDIVLFGGDLVDHFSIKPLNSENSAYLTSKLKSITARYGKFAVLGNHDIDSPIIIENTTNILNDADFEILNNESIMVRKSGKNFINIIGIESMILGKPDIEKAYNNIRDAYTIVLSHTPDIFDSIILDKTDLMLAGHSHGGQIYIPFISSFLQPIGAKKYYKGKYYENETMLDITNGVGTTKKDIRLFADAEIVVYKFKTTNVS